ncbi:MAG: hypothetical protein QF741_03555 [Candidatus Peribacteraceae bacterium]|jgi:hypothetical protein|nr:hypothetical protein [Candidatus Peribacteraceae bacterium]MDP7454329.1 hypothetical protein [Candidatus Peribacteraceae bacterium]MDP7645727.1 hypothetical protein [Candidatus Peribacteraceae bacterium]|tara:strand:- start:1547 stop:1966 length:420 start_codon:yes stop_codon:yes gene_type:complete
MSVNTILKGPGTLSRVLAEFLSWYFLEMPVTILKTAKSYVSTFNEIFSFMFLIRTFLSPWKSITDKYPEKGFNIGIIAQAFTLNMTSRVIGIIFRSVAFLIGVIVELIVLGIFIFIFSVWIFFPLLLVADLFYLIGSFT